MITEITNDIIFNIEANIKNSDTVSYSAVASQIKILDNFCDDFEESLRLSLTFENNNEELVNIDINLEYRELIRIKKAIESHLEAIQHFYLQVPNKNDR